MGMTPRESANIFVRFHEDSAPNSTKAHMARGDGSIPASPTADLVLIHPGQSRHRPSRKRRAEPAAVWGAKPAGGCKRDPGGDDDHSLQCGHPLWLLRPLAGYPFNGLGRPAADLSRLDPGRRAHEDPASLINGMLAMAAICWAGQPRLIRRTVLRRASQR
jgi:hypothetical protein